MQRQHAAGAEMWACSVNVVWVAGGLRALHLHLEGIQKQPAAGAEQIGLYTERGLGRGWVADSPPGTNATEARRRRRTNLVCILNVVWAAGWSRGGSRALHLERMQKKPAAGAEKFEANLL